MASMRLGEVLRWPRESNMPRMHNETCFADTLALYLLCNMTHHSPEPSILIKLSGSSVLDPRFPSATSMCLYENQCEMIVWL